MRRSTMALATGALIAFNAAAQPGAVDLSWDPVDVGHGQGEGATSGFGFGTLVMQPDDRVIVAGDFTDYNGTRCDGLVRLLPDGTVDSSFAWTAQPTGVAHLVLQPDGKVLVARSQQNPYVTRLLPNGQVEPGFGVGAVPDQPVTQLALRADGKVMVAGSFNTIGGVYRPQLARLNADGTLDPSFDMGGGTDGIITDMVVQPDDKVIIAGWFTTVDGAPWPGLARVNADGSLDNTFVVGSAFQGGPVRAMVLQPDGRLVVGGDFTSYNGQQAPRCVRLMPDGSRDVSFTVGGGFNDEVFALMLRSDGRLVVGGAFTLVDGAAHERLVRLMPDGTLDPTFAVGDGPNDAVHAVVEQTDGKLVHGGRMFLHGQRHRMRLGRVHADGTDDQLYNPGSGAAGTVQRIVQQPDGRILIAGAFLSYNDTLAGRLVRVLPNGFVDTSFQAHRGPLTANASIRALAVQPDGRILAGGSFIGYDSSTGDDIVRLLPNGEADSSFDVGSGTDDGLNAIALQADGKVLIGGSFTEVDGVPRTRIARLDSDGAVDFSFDPGSGFNGFVNALAVQPDGRILVGGSFDSYNGTTVRRLARLLPDGSLDPSFDHQYGVFLGQVVYSIVVEPDGRILIGGNFDSYDLWPYGNLARLLPDGNADLSFPQDLDIDGYVTSIDRQSDGRIVIGGAFQTVAGASRRHVARLNADGTHDLSFDPGAGPEGAFIGYVYTLEVTDTDDVLIGGAFTRVDGVGRNHAARLFGGASVDIAPSAVLEVSAWNVHPVPTTGVIHLNLPHGAATLDVLLPDGRVLTTMPACATLDLGPFPSGAYLLRVLGADRAPRGVCRLVKE